MVKNHEAERTIKIPGELVKLSRLASDAMQGAFVLAELDGYRYFRKALASRLKEQGWPIDTDKEYDGMHRFMNDVFASFSAKAPSFYIRYNLKAWLQAPFCPDEVRQFVLDKKNFSPLETAIKAAIQDTQQKYGDPMAVKFHQSSGLKAAFNAVKSKITAKTPETELCKIFKSALKTMSLYSKEKKVPFIEFQGRMEQQLEKLQWKINEKDDIHRPLASELWSLASAAQARTSVGIRYSLQDDTLPPRKPYREAKDFILANARDITAAVKSVTEEFDKELATPEGLKPRHFRWR